MGKRAQRLHLAQRFPLPDHVARIKLVLVPRRERSAGNLPGLWFSHWQ